MCLVVSAKQEVIMKLFFFGEAWGKQKCHVCGKPEYMTLLNDEEAKEIENMGGIRAALYISVKKIGKPVCQHHKNIY